MRSPDGFEASDTPRGSVVDLSYRLRARELPVDHGPELCEAILEHLPWFAQEPQAGLHPIRVAPSANGWLRPEAGSEDLMQLSKRTRLTLRIPQARVPDGSLLEEQRLQVRGCRLEVGASQSRALRPSATLFCGHVWVDDRATSEGAFLEWVEAQLRALGIRPRKLLAGLVRTLGAHAEPYTTRSVLVAALAPEESLTLQCRGMGPGRTIGCGVFTPHKGIGPVDPENDAGW